MCRDCYELDLPQPTWVEQVQENKELIRNAGLVVGVSTVIFIASCILEFKLRKVKFD